MKPKLISRRQVFNAHVCDLPVGHTDYCTIESPNAGGTQADILDYAECITRIQRLPDAYRLIKDQGGPADYVFQYFLCCQCDGNAAHPKASKCGSRADAEVVENDE